MSKDAIIDLILENEGGLNTNEPANVGGVSYAGITQVTYTEWLKKAHPFGAPPGVQGLEHSPKVVKEFYEDYLARYHVWEVPEFLQYMYADFVTNAGKAAVKIVQRMAEVDDDGGWGRGTSRAVSTWRQSVESALVDDPDIDNDLITRFHEEKLAHYQNLADKNPDKYGQYLSGWKRRANHVLSQLQPYFASDAKPEPAIDDDDAFDEPEEESADQPVTSNSFEEIKEMLQTIITLLKKRG